MLGEDAVDRAVEGGGHTPEAHLFREGGDALFEGFHIGAGLQQLHFRSDALLPEPLLALQHILGEAETGLQLFAVARHHIVVQLEEDLPFADGFPFGDEDALDGALGHREDPGHAVHVALDGEVVVEGSCTDGEGGHLSGVGDRRFGVAGGRLGGRGCRSAAGGEEQGGNRQKEKGADHGIRR